MTAFRHQPFWCEENVWHLAQDPATAAPERLVLVTTGSSGQVACWHQKAGDADAPVLWDYHVVLATRDGDWRLWDLDSRAGAPVAARTWLEATFPVPKLVPEPYRPRFAVFDADDYLLRFGSDRGHMRTPDGRWSQPPPPWPLLAGHGLTLADALAQARRGVDLEALTARLR